MGKHRKWDDPTPRSREKCLEAAKEAAAKVFSRLLAEGKINPEDENKEPPLMNTKKEETTIKPDFIPLPTTVATLTATSTDSNQAFSCEIEINDITYACRNLLTKSVTQEDILKVSGAKVATRGRFMSSEEKTQASGVGDRPLYLSVQGPNQQSVEVAVQRISSIIHSMCNVPLSSLSISSGMTNIKSIMSTASLVNSSAPPLAFVQDKLFVGLEHAPPNFDVKQKILGPNGSYLQHIQLETGAKVMLRGKGSGFIEPTSGREAFEPMFIYLQHSNHTGLQQAKQLAQNLLETVQRDYAGFQQALALAPPAVNPGTASMLAGLQQPAFPLSNPMWTASITCQGSYNPGFPYPTSSTPTFPSGPPSMNFQSPVLAPGSRQSYNGSGSLFVPPTGLQMPTVLPMFGGPGLRPAMPPPPPPPPPVTTQISSVSVALGYYEQYLASPASTTTSSDASGSKGAFREGSISRTHRRRFQEKVEEEEHEDVENDFLGKKTALQEEASSSATSASSSALTKDVMKDLAKEDNKPTHGPAKDSEGFVVPPPVISLKRKRPESDTKESSSFKVPSNQPKKIQGALKSVVAYYGSGSEDDDEDEDDSK